MSEPNEVERTAVDSNALFGLVRKWRDHAEQVSGAWYNDASGYEQCADELDAELSKLVGANEVLKTELIHLAAILVRFTVPVFSDHWDWCKTTPAKERARIIEEFRRVDDLLKGVAVRLRKCADSIVTD